MDNQIIINLIKTLVNEKLILIDTEKCLSECTVKVHKKKKSNDKEVVLFILSAKED